MESDKLIQAIQADSVTGMIPENISGIHFDSRKIQPGFLFVAISGTQTDGHDFIENAIDNGAAVIVCEKLPGNTDKQACFIQVKDSADALGKLASKWNNDPSSQLTLVGVTGTNGKTTIATLLYNVFRKFGNRVGLISTVCNYINEEKLPATHTTPDPIELNELLNQMVQDGCKYAFMEVSSHAISQKRISGLTFKGGIFTNLTRDHLDYHETFEAYRDTKKHFFDTLPREAFALTNEDDKNGMFMLQNTKASKYTYSCLTLADFRGKILEPHFDGTLMLINNKEVNTQFVGNFNAYNLLAVYGASVLLGKSEEDVLLVLSTLQSVAGRFQPVRSPHGYTAIVDYAHTPDALTNVLNAIREIGSRTGRIITVVGCGGNRDAGKRPIMAKEAVRLSDQVILTSDNPRFEDPQEIINDMLNGLSKSEIDKTLSIVNRREAIKTACMLAQRGDIILIAGKGHEDYQEIKGEKYPFDDKKTVMEIFNG